MIELRIAKSPVPEPAQEGTSRIVVKLFVAAGVLIVLMVMLVVSSWNFYSRRYTEIDHSADSLKTAFLPAPARETTTGARLVQLQSVTTYENTKSGVKLKLPGIWTNVSIPNMQKPDPAHRYCVLRSLDGIYMAFWPLFPDYLPSIEADGLRCNNDS